MRFLKALLKIEVDDTTIVDVAITASAQNWKLPKMSISVAPMYTMDQSVSSILELLKGQAWPSAWAHNNTIP